jgi:hypothetical protein
VEGGSSGRLVLRLVSSDENGVEYAGELSAPEGTWAVNARVGAAGDVRVERPADAPDWLVATARATLRTAWRSRKAGTPWPRRLSRWRSTSDDEGAER